MTRCPDPAHFTVYCLNVLTQKFATSDLYQYCPSWALTWEYRKDLILQDILQQSADIVCLQVRACKRRSRHGPWNAALGHGPWNAVLGHGP